MKKFVNKEVIRSMMQKIWKTSKPISDFDFGSNTYIFSFENEVDMKWIMSHRPWLFESSLFSLKPFDRCTPASKMDISKENF